MIFWATAYIVVALLLTGALAGHAPDAFDWRDVVCAMLWPATLVLTLGFVLEQSSVYTDEARGYQGLGRWYNHQTVNHQFEYVRGLVHTNSVEGFWNLFKRCFSGTWTHLSEAHLHRYMTEQEWRYNTREGNDGARFGVLLNGISGKRLTWKQLTAQE